MPAALIKACCDEFTYAMRLRSGEVIQFNSASWAPGSQWVQIQQIGSVRPDRDIALHRFSSDAMSFDRGMDVRISDIVWVADAPWGS